MAPHVLVVVENIPFCIDPRLTKQVDALLDNGYRVSVVTRRDPGNDAYRALPGLRILEFPSPAEPRNIAGYAVEYGTALLWAVALSARVRLRDTVDVLQLCQPPDVYLALVGAFRALGAGVVVDQRDLMPELYSARYASPRPQVTRALRLLERLSWRAASHVLCVNEYLRERVRSAGVAADRVTVVRNGPVLGRVARATPVAGDKQGGRYLCCWTGKMGRQDRLDLLLQAIGHLVHGLGRTDCRFVLLGDGECLEEAQSLVGQLRLAEWVSFPGWVAEETVFRYLASADLGLDASLQEEVSPVKAIEYMALGVPLVAFDLRETRAAAQDAAAYVPPGDVTALARTIDELLDDPARRRAMGRAGRGRVEHELAWDRQAATYVGVIGGLLRRRRRPVRGGV